ncbi:MAG: plasmid stabilization system [uncultured bacterium]|nr:MAG: plasmid stabilization system [uncultured bacterium]
MEKYPEYCKKQDIEKSKVKKEIFKNPQVYFDIIEIAEYISQDCWQLAEKFLNDTEQTFSLIMENPKIGTPKKMKNPRFFNLRFLPVNNFKKILIFYSELKNRIEIFRVIHGSRDLKSILDTVF